MATVGLPLIVIVGPTASGKTGLSIELAAEFGGEIISADSRAVYRGLNIGTAKPTAQEMKGVPHWGIDLVDVDQSFTAADFQSYAYNKIREIRQRGAIPFLVGGTGLYVDSVLYRYEFGPTADSELRNRLKVMTTEQLYKYCIKNNIQLPGNQKNKRHLMRAIEQGGVNNRRSESILDNTVVVGITTEKLMLKKRIADRARDIFDSGVVDETSLMLESFDERFLADKGAAYKGSVEYMRGTISYEEAIEALYSNDSRLAKRQLTWFRRNSDIEWLDLDDAREYMRSVLADNSAT